VVKVACFKGFLVENLLNFCSFFVTSLLDIGTVFYERVVMEYSMANE
jgi:hypothetical protein